MKYLHGHYTTQTHEMQGDFRRWKHRVKIAQTVPWAVTPSVNAIFGSTQRTRNGYAKTPHNTLWTATVRIWSKWREENKGNSGGTTNMIEHPVITQTERTGYPFSVREQITCCQDCGRELTGSDLIFDWDGDQICEDCCETAIEENFSIMEIAEALSITAKCAADLEDY